jgi:hypothetical protein
MMLVIFKTSTYFRHTPCHLFAGDFKCNWRLLWLSFFTLAAGFFIYYFFRSGNILMYHWVKQLPKNAHIITFSGTSFPASFFCYNLPDGLWLFSGLLFLRALWNEEPYTLFIYKLCFLFFAFFLEISQIYGKIAGTFDVLDLLTMGLFAYLESILYRFQFIRRQS